MKNQIGIVYSIFDETLGPTPKISIPKINNIFGSKIAQKSIDVLSFENMRNPKSLAFLPFPAETKKGVVRLIEWKDENARGNIRTGSLTLIFSEDNDAIFYKYIKDLEIVFNEAAERIIELNRRNADKETLIDELREIYLNFKKLLDELEIHEFGAKNDSEAFPEQDNSDNKMNHLYKVVICGDAGCGKTSIVLRFTDQAFRRTYIPTLGVNVSRKETIIGDNNILLMLWDIAGQQKFSFVRKSFYKGAHAIIIIYDLTRSETLADVRKWLEDVKKAIKYQGTTIGILCGNKKDLEHMRKVSYEEAKTLADELGLQYYETSALTGENINEVFFRLGKTLLE